MQLCLRFCFWILQSQISTVYGIRNLYCSASFVTLISIGISTGLSYLLKPRNIQGEFIQAYRSSAAILELQLSRIFTETQEWHRL